MGDELPGQGQDQAERVVGDLVDAIIRDVADRDAPGPGRVEVHVIDPDPVADDRPGPAHRPDDPGVDRGELGEDAVRVGDQRQEGVGLVLRVRPDDLAAHRLEDGPLHVERVERVIGDGDLHEWHLRDPGRACHAPDPGAAGSSACPATILGISMGSNASPRNREEQTMSRRGFRVADRSGSENASGREEIANTKGTKDTKKAEILWARKRSSLESAPSGGQIRLKPVLQHDLVEMDERPVHDNSAVAALSPCAVSGSCRMQRARHAAGEHGQASMTCPAVKLPVTVFNQPMR